MRVDDYGLEVLDAAECRALLAGRRIGRIGTSVDALPVIVPLYYALDGDYIAVRIPSDTSLDKAVVDCVVCFEVDNLNESPAARWGVSVTGKAERVVADADIARLEALGLPELGVGAHWVRIPTSVVDGRRRNLA